MGMKEINRDKLIEGLQKLPSHKAPDAIWNNIERSLKQDPALQEAIKTLPSYKALFGTGYSRKWPNLLR